MLKSLAAVGLILGLFLAAPRNAEAVQGQGGDLEPKWWCCQAADVSDGPEAAGCSASCTEGGVPLGSAACSEAGNSSGPYVYPGGCLMATSEAECTNTTSSGNLPLFWCRTRSCGAGLYECGWVPDGSTFSYTWGDCEGTPCFGG